MNLGPGEPAEGGRLATSEQAGAERAGTEPASTESATIAEAGQAAADGERAQWAASPEPARVTEPGGRPGIALPGEPAGDLEGPLLGDAAGLRAGWQRIQAGFVDDPREAVTDAAHLVEHTAQALAGALRRRQQGLRAMLDGTGAPGAAEPADDGQPAAGGPDTEQLRLLLRRYRDLFSQICPP